MCWIEPFVKLRAPKLFNLRRDPFERADENSNTYWDWYISHAYIIYAMQAVVGSQIDELREVPAAAEAGLVQPGRRDARPRGGGQRSQPLTRGGPPSAATMGARPDFMLEHDAPVPDPALVAQAVSAFYERHPYPPPVDDLDSYRRSWTDDRRRVDACLFWPAEPYRDDRRILVAGCGTSQAAKVALRWPRAQVVGIDVSGISIQQTERLKRKHSIENLELQQLPVERATQLGAFSTT